MLYIDNILRVNASASLRIMDRGRFLVGVNSSLGLIRRYGSIFSWVI